MPTLVSIVTAVAGDDERASDDGAQESMKRFDAEIALGKFASVELC